MFGQADLQIGRRINSLAVGLQPAVGDAEHQAAAHHALEVDAIFDQLHLWRDHALELHFAGGKRHALAGLAQPAEEKAGQLPHGVEAEAARHDRVADEMAGEEPEIRLDVEIGPDEIPCRRRRRFR
jgi:hypothetical protein